VLRLGVLPRLIVPMQSLVLATDVPNNPAVEDDELKVLFNLKVD